MEPLVEPPEVLPPVVERLEFEPVLLPSVLPAVPPVLLPVKPLFVLAPLPVRPLPELFEPVLPFEPDARPEVPLVPVVEPEVPPVAVPVVAPAVPLLPWA